MLNQLRGVAGNLAAKVLLALLVLSFAVWGIGDMINAPSRNRTVATVGDHPITIDNYERTYRREMDNVRRSLGDNYSPEVIKSLNIPEYVLHRLVNRALLRLESQALGLIPSDADIVRRIRSNPAFQDDKGEFDKSAFQAFLRNTDMSEQAYVDLMRMDLATGLIMDTFTSATPVPDTAIRAVYDALEEQRTATLYLLSPAAVTNIPQPSEEQINEYYKTHGQAFSAPEYRTLSYVTIRAEDVHKKASVSEEEIQAAYQERIEEFKRPERRAVEQLLYSSEEKARKAHALLKGGASFKQVAKDTDIMNKGVVSLGKVEQGSVINEAADAVFSLKAGEVTEPIKSAFGWHIFKVTAIDPPSTVPLEEARAALEKDLLQSSGDDALNRLANRLEDALAGGSTLQEAASAESLQMSSVGPVNRQGDTPEGKPAKDLPALDKFLETAFKTDEKGESSLVASKNGVYYIVRVDSVIPERVRDLKEVRGQVIAAWQNAEREKQLLELTKDISDKLSNPALREKTVAQYRLNAVASGPLKHSSRLAGDLQVPSGLVADIFSRRPGQATGAHPFKNGGYVAAVVKDILPAPAPSTAQLNKIRGGLQGVMQNELVEQYLNHLAEKYTVTINREVLDAMTAQ